MKIDKIVSPVLKWIPTLIVTLFFIPNALDKIQNPIQPDKVITSSTLMICVGIILLIATALFLYNKTMLIGAFILASYIGSVTVIHLYKGKPHEVVLLVTMCTVFAAFLRKPDFFHSKKES